MRADEGRKDAMRYRVERMPQLSAEVWDLMEEYYTSAAVVLRDDAAATERFLQNPQSGLWVVFVDGEAAGCVLLRAGVPDRESGECKRLYVRPAYRRLGLANILMQTLEDDARTAGLAWVYLDTTEVFQASVKLYRLRGYESCERYNNNPQATMFFRKRLTAPEVADVETGD